MSDSKRLKEMKNVWNCTKVHFNPDTFGWIDYLIEYAENLEVEMSGCGRKMLNTKANTNGFTAGFAKRIRNFMIPIPTTKD
ncbi:hypothetical protein MOD20_18380 [Bacillus licheniformis]|uniref:hypothetical protein n=1 Tax=Bacillus licheniformis TaxID=1402 RepID=UPI002282AE1C|nr:hypothetical protein [Bacillus licheniformis]MCY8531044.1 hypothetical protein [Bacillus licheniformis]